MNQDFGRKTGEKGAIGRIGSPDGVVYGKYVATLDYNNSDIVKKVTDAVTDIRFQVGKNLRYIVDENLTDLKLDKDPRPGDTAKTRVLRGWVYLYHNYSDMVNTTDVDTRLLIKRKIIAAIREGISNYNEDYTEDNMIIKSCEPVMDRFQYGEKSVYVYFILEEERYKGDTKPEIEKHDIGNGKKRFVVNKQI